MSGTFPSSPGFRAVNMRSQDMNYFSESVSGRTQARSRGGQRWAFTAKFPPMSRATFGPVLAFVAAQDGRLETFQIVLPEISDAAGTASGTVLSDGGGSIGDSTIDVDGLTGTLAPGDYFKWASHSKVYMVTAERDGDGTLSFTPSLVEDVADNEQLTYDSVPFTVRLNNDVQEWQAGLGELYEFELDMIEAL
jgi:hypothetical protein